MDQTPKKSVSKLNCLNCFKKLKMIKKKSVSIIRVRKRNVYIAVLFQRFFFCWKVFFLKDLFVC